MQRLCSHSEYHEQAPPRLAITEPRGVPRGLGATLALRCRTTQSALSIASWGLSEGHRTQGHQKELDIQQKAFGETHPDIARTYNSMGGVYEKKGDTAQAAVFYQKAYNIFLATLGPAHAHTGMAKSNLDRVRK